MKIIKTNEIENHHIFCLVVGASGVGKTSLVKTLPANETIILSAESGLLSVKDSKIDVVEIASYQQLISTLKDLKENDHKYKNIFIDSLTELGQQLFTSMKPNYEKSQMFGLYADYSDQITATLKALRGLTKYNIYLTALDKSVENGINVEISIDLIQKSLAKRIPALFDEVFYMQVVEHEGEKKRVLATDNSIQTFCKDRSGKLNTYELPDLGAINNKIFNNNNS
jgi:phage nucleotide-binding protein